jgi:hypothetical protein
MFAIERIINSAASGSFIETFHFLMLPVSIPKLKSRKTDIILLFGPVHILPIEIYFVLPGKHNKNKDYL